MQRMLWLVIVLLLPTPSFADDPPNRGQLWKDMKWEGQIMYVQGYEDGGFRALLAVRDHDRWPVTNNKWAPDWIQHVFLKAPAAQISDVMTDLYKDPANAYIQWDEMLLIAREKLEGTTADIAGRLRQARAKALFEHRFQPKTQR